MNKALPYIQNLRVLFIPIFIVLSIHSFAQRATNSVLVNFGRISCDSTYFGSDLSLIADPLGTGEDLFLQCNTSNPIDNVISKFVSYNAINNKLYINDISDYVNSNIYILNIGLPANCTCPNLDSVSYTIPDVILNQFEFDPTGDLYALSNYDSYMGTANIGAYDDTTGLLETGSLKTLYFPSGQFPSDVSNGDLVIIPNGRMFCIFGYDTSRLFEITNYLKTDIGDAIATSLGNPSQVCYSIAFENGNLIMGGTDLAGYCYSFKYDLSANTLSTEQYAPLNIMPIDFTSFSASIAASMRIVASKQTDATHYELTYEIYIQNLGNVKAGNVQLTDDLESVFGAGNVSNVSTSFISNGANLSLNNSFNGTSNLKMLKVSPAQTLPNYSLDETTSTIELKVTVANAIPDSIYWNSAIITGKIGKDSTLLTVLDSSNNYTSLLYNSWVEAVDPNRNNVADDPNEGLPTPWEIGIMLPIELAQFSVHPENSGALLDWSTLSEEDNHYFAIERSTDAVVFDSVGMVKGAGTSVTSNTYSFFDQSLPKATVYYRLRQMNSKGDFAYSELKVLNYDPHHENNVVNYKVYPNPATDFIIYESSGICDHDATVEIRDVFGMNVLTTTIPGFTLRQKIMLPELSEGYYFVTVRNASQNGGFFRIFVNN